MKTNTFVARISQRQNGRKSRLFFYRIYSATRWKWEKWKSSAVTCGGSFREEWKLNKFSFFHGGKNFPRCKVDDAHERLINITFFGISTFRRNFCRLFRSQFKAVVEVLKSRGCWNKFTANNLKFSSWFAIKLKCSQLEKFHFPRKTWKSFICCFSFVEFNFRENAANEFLLDYSFH